MIDLTKDRLKDMRAWARWEGFPFFPMPKETERASGLIFTPGMPVALMCEKIYDVLDHIDEVALRKILLLAGDIVSRGERALEQDQAMVRADEIRVHPARLIVGPYRVVMFCLERVTAIRCSRSKLFASLALWALEVHRSHLLSNNSKQAEFAFRNAALFLVEALLERGKELSKELEAERRRASARKSTDTRYRSSREAMREMRAFWSSKTWRSDTVAASALIKKFELSKELDTVKGWIRTWRRTSTKAS